MATVTKRDAGKLQRLGAMSKEEAAYYTTPTTIRSYNLVVVYRGACCSERHVWVEEIRARSVAEAKAQLCGTLARKQLAVELVLRVPRGDVSRLGGAVGV